MKTDGKHYCTECGKESFVSLSGWTGPQGVIIRADEHLCIPCAKKRGIENPLAPAKKGATP